MIARPERKQIRVVYRAGEFTCKDEDLDLMARRGAWLSGDGLAVFIQHELSRTNVEDVSIIHSRMLWDVAIYQNCLRLGLEDQVAANKNCILTAMQKVSCSAHMAINGDLLYDF